MKTWDGSFIQSHIMTEKFGTIGRIGGCSSYSITTCTPCCLNTMPSALLHKNLRLCPVHDAACTSCVSGSAPQIQAAHAVPRSQHKLCPLKLVLQQGYTNLELISLCSVARQTELVSAVACSGNSLWFFCNMADASRVCFLAVETHPARGWPLVCNDIIYICI